MPALATFPQQLADAAGTHGDRIFIYTPSGEISREISYADLDRLSTRVASGLLGRGLRPGDRIAIAAPNGIEWLALFFGATRIGLLVVTLNVRYREHELEYMLNHSGAKAVVTVSALADFDYAAFYASFRERIPGVEHIFFIEGVGGAAAAGPAFSELARAEPDTDAVLAAEAGVEADTPAVILYTSGTTGTPKGAVLTHGSVLASAAAQAGHLGTGDEDVYLGLLPLNHVGGLTCTVSAALVSRAAVVLMPSFSPETAIAAAERHRVTVFGGVPTMYTLILGRPEFASADLGSVRIALVGGSNADPALCASIAQRFPDARLTNLYGLSECSGGCVFSAAEDDLATVSRTLGVPIGDFQARVVDGGGTEVGPGGEGELHLRGGGVAAGYWGTAGEGAETFLPGGWLATGDMVALEPDGHLVLRGRKKEMFLQGGYNVYPVEVENVLTAHPAVAMAAGIGVPDPVLGEIGRYYVVPKPGVDAPGEAELIEFCRARLADYKAPRQIRFAEELPLTPAGKIAKAALRASADT
ncbi:class I adenylate-forming enzyme family protein [Amycolatopsis nigrescens]|uniref:class I adenylate-forming enzyme family protein n=1 Tax=Amycolatopsis nigrescens TaxID=381445 RepID=UPI000379EEFE|nr:AMP-binding protein [Amycolatopsis nigrescens]